MNENLKVQGYFLIDVDVVALNNAGKNNISNFDNAIATKVIYKNGLSYPYVSGQAVRFWWRDTLQKHCGWVLSPVIREDKVSYTQADPVKYPDDDVFGYMRAASEITEDEKGKKKKVNITVTRVSPLKNSALISVSSVRPVENWSSMARGEGDSVPYSKQEYSAVMKGMFSLDLNMVGTFSNYNKTGYMNLSD
ncbi:MAG TPA: type I-B CRISPR-associated protein Cas7/Cst2/DevR, partial [Candidatus Paraprevotella stercorigallinarum]|nr:type I-B CRISPR-associated protein Cas7/Cst2/DevR [Candidatus Paraprevotella stercorigallinarum]